MVSPKILAFAGSTRRDSFNRKLLTTAVAGAREAGAEVTVVELSDYELPLFNQDLEAEQGLPAAALKLKELFVAHQGLLIASPEYNSSFTPLLKNTLDWVSRSSPGETGLVAFQGKAAALVSASPGALGGLRGLVHLRSLLGNINVLVIPTQVAVSKAMDAFADDGSLKDARQAASVKQVGAQLAELLKKLSS
ncbi:FMN-dependent NADPH-azoreductase [Anatilimnocola aggregata]|uniref:FMN-dependent NADPH-azoreductase n=1 Tax=Anatilimnocola aggregata TaxID=2528021 RepID=A0A517YMP5_9BACT|nr:NAD(P)H-dependent oxidoreductase [Anatilimnocola aggregata]QDU31499.1 FMN-dependent NADPH-azoreductase [Anatilimnocola aggregata]